MNTPGVEVRLEYPRQSSTKNSFRALYKYVSKIILVPNRNITLKILLDTKLLL